MFTYRLYAPGSDIDVALSYYAYVRDDKTGLYLDSDSVYRSFDQLVDGKWTMSENPDQPGEWLLVLDTDFTGVWVILPRAADTDELFTDQVLRVYVVNGVVFPNPFEEVAHLHESYGGFEAFKFVDEDGGPVEGARVYVYEKTAYDLRNLVPPYGLSSTDHRGYWTAPVTVAPGMSYMIVFSKPGLTTVAVEVGVPGPIP
jgi:hypothetical protein